MKISLYEDNKNFLLLKNLNDFEKESVQAWFTKEPDNAWILKKKSPWLNTKYEFVNRFGLIPIGLWLELIRYAKKRNVKLEFDPEINDVIQDTKLSYETFKYYVDTLFENAENDKGDKINPMGYQLEGVFKLLKYKKCCVEVTTSGGKTIMAYILYKFLRDVKHIKKCLYIVPNKNLATQSFDKFNLYEDWVKGSHDFKLAYLIGSMNKTQKKMLENHDIVFATYQSLIRKDNNFFKDYDMILVDECHHSQAKSIRNIIRKCENAKYVFGVTGTLPKEGSYDRYQIESFIGPLVYTLSAFELINKEKFATPIYIINTILNYATEEEKKLLYEARKYKNSDDINAGTRLLKQEQLFINNNYARMKYICSLAKKAKFNTLILFNDVNGGDGYGKKLFDYLKDNTEKDIYYADGETDTKVRDYYNQQMEDDESGNTVIVGSYGTYSEGLDISNIGVIILAQSFKSSFILRQSIGRGMRRGANKDKVVLFDIIDDLRYGEPGDREYLKNNYMWKQHLERNKTYNSQKFPVLQQKIDFTKE